MGSAPPGHWKSLCITHLATCPNQNSPTDSADEAPSDAEGLAIPYGIYDPRANAGTVFVGRTADTPAFSVDCIE